METPDATSSDSYVIEPVPPDVSPPLLPLFDTLTDSFLVDVPAEQQYAV
jgi:hypothetical protein